MFPLTNLVMTTRGRLDHRQHEGILDANLTIVFETKYGLFVLLTNMICLTNCSYSDPALSQKQNGFLKK